MWPNPEETMVWSHLPKKSLIQKFIFCAVKELKERFLRQGYNKTLTEKQIEKWDNLSKKKDREQQN